MRPRRPPPRARDSGFTLLEVMLSLALLAIFLTILVQTMGQVVMLKTEEHRIITATNLARAKMVDVEIMLQEDGWGSFEKEECGDFQRDFPDLYDDYEWCFELKKATLAIPPELIGQAVEGAGGGAEGGAEGGGGAATAELLSTLGIDIGDVTEQLSEGIRILQITIKWKDGNDTDEVVLSTHLVSMTQAGIQ